MNQICNKTSDYFVPYRIPAEDYVLEYPTDFGCNLGGEDHRFRKLKHYRVPAYTIY